MATQSELNVLTQPYRNINISIEVLDFNYYILDEINGIATSASFSINADSDIRRTCNINMVLNDEFSQDKLATQIYWNSGNPFWFDKYLKIKIGIDDILTGETVWSNQGIYLINEPSLFYDAENNTLSFQGVDLMAKLTGMRDGNLEGTGYTIPVCTNIRSAMTNILLEYGFTQYIIINPPQDITPYEIKVDAGGTAYDLLSELRDVNPNWEMFFDVDGVFYFQEIVSNAIEGDVITPFIDAETFKMLDSSVQLDTSFEDVKNCIEVYGKTLEYSYVPVSVNIVGDMLDIAINEDLFTIGNVYDYSFTLGNLENSPTLLSTPLTQLRVTIGTGISSSISLPTPAIYNNMSYAFRIRGRLGITSWAIDWLGYTQPFGMAWDDNEESPFWVGEEITSYNYTSPIDAVYNKPKFEKQVRIVLSGGEYDNIYSNELAMQRAKYELYLRSSLHDSIQITLLPIYWMDVNQIIEYQMPNEEELSYWLVKSVSTDFSVEGKQSITAIRYYFNQ